MSVDRLVFFVVLLSAAFVAGMELGEVKSAAELEPCPKQTGFMQTSSTYSTSTGLQCFYRPNGWQAKR